MVNLQGFNMTAKYMPAGEAVGENRSKKLLVLEGRLDKRRSFFHLICAYSLRSFLSSLSSLIFASQENEGVHFNPHRPGRHSGWKCMLGTLLPRAWHSGKHFSRSSVFIQIYICMFLVISSDPWESMPLRTHHIFGLYVYICILWANCVYSCADHLLVTWFRSINA